MMYLAYKLNKQGDNIQPCCTCFLILNQSIVASPVLTFASWPAYRFLRRQVRWSGISISLVTFQIWLIHTVKGFHVVNEAEADVFMESLAFSTIQWTLTIWSLVSLPFLNPVYTFGSSWFMYCWTLAWRILSITLLAYDRILNNIFPLFSWHCVYTGNIRNILLTVSNDTFYIPVKQMQIRDK